MKIAYIAEVNLDTQYGVWQKILMQAKSWITLGHDVEIFLGTFKYTERPFEKFCNIYPTISNNQPGKPNLIKGIINKYVIQLKMAKKLQEFNPDIIYYRYKIWYPFLIGGLLSRGKYVVELNTDDVNERRLKGFLRYVYNKITRNFILKNAAGFVAISEEIAKKNASFNKPICVIANGYDLSVAKVFPAPNNDKPKLLFVGSDRAPWHGVDKIIVMAKLLKEFEFHIVGPSKEGYIIPDNVIFHGYLERNEIINLYKSCDIGIGTLALHRNNMVEASPLKVREYLAYGLPVIIGYEDTDLKEDSSAILRLPNNEDNVINCIELIKNFVENNFGKRINREVFKQIDYQYKETKRIKFLENVLKEKQF